MGIAQKLCAASKACGYVQKDGANNFHKYRFVSAANILGHVNAALEAAGLAVVDTLPEIVSETGAGKDRVVTARMTLTVADTESGERATFRGLGSGMDSGDKAVMKAVTAATKYAWMGAFSISTGDDPEADEETDKRAAQSSKPQRQSSPQRTARREEPDESPAMVEAAPPTSTIAGDSTGAAFVSVTTSVFGSSFAVLFFEVFFGFDSTFAGALFDEPFFGAVFFESLFLVVVFVVFMVTLDPNRR